MPVMLTRTRCGSQEETHVAGWGSRVGDGASTATGDLAAGAGLGTTLFIGWTPQYPGKPRRGSADVCGGWIHEWREASVPSTHSHFLVITIFTLPCTTSHSLIPAWQGEMEA